MSLQGVNQHLRVYVSPASAATEPTVPANGTTLDLDSVVAGTGLPLGGITYRSNLNLATVRDDATMSTTVPYMIVYKDMAGVVHMTKVDPADVISTDLARAAVTEVQQATDLTIATATEGASYVIKLEVPEYGGQIGAKDEARFYGTHVAPVGATTASIATALQLSLKAACDAAPVPFCAVTNGTASKVTITGIAQPYHQARWTGKTLRFFLSLTSPDALQTGSDAGGTEANPGNGNYKQVAGLEEFFAGETRGYANRYADWPNNTNPVLAAEAGAEYTSDTITMAIPYGDVNLGTQRQTIQLFFKE